VEQADNLPTVMYANLVGFNITGDDMLLEFWEHRPGHATPPIEPAEVVKTKRPIARIVIPFSSARFLRDQLVDLVAKQETNRKAGL